MARIRARDTRPEMAVRRAAHSLGYRFRLHRRDLPGTPDLVFPKLKTVIFVHGCFWHRHEGCRNCSTPSTRPEFWRAKLAANVARDAASTAQLLRLGWTVEVVWECETRDTTVLAERLERTLSAGSAT